MITSNWLLFDFLLLCNDNNEVITLLNVHANQLQVESIVTCLNHGQNSESIYSHINFRVIFFRPSRLNNRNSNSPPKFIDIVAIKNSFDSQLFLSLSPHQMHSAYTIRFLWPNALASAHMVFVFIFIFSYALFRSSVSAATTKAHTHAHIHSLVSLLSLMSFTHLQFYRTCFERIFNAVCLSVWALAHILTQFGYNFEHTSIKCFHLEAIQNVHA